MTKSEKLSHLKGLWTKEGLERQIAKCNYKRSTEKTNTILQLYFVDGISQNEIAKKVSVSNQGISNTLTRFLARLYKD